MMIQPLLLHVGSEFLYCSRVGDNSAPGLKKPLQNEARLEKCKQVLSLWWEAHTHLSQGMHLFGP